VGRICNTHGGDKKCVHNFSLKTLRDRPRHRCEDSIKMDLKQDKRVNMWCTHTTKF
jgi:hypothetical protein